MTRSRQGGHGERHLYTDADASGSFSLPGRPPVAFSASVATAPSGFYQVRKTTVVGTFIGRWVVGATGKSAGVVRFDTVIVGSPPLAATISLGKIVLTPTRTTTVPSKLDMMGWP